MSKKKEKKLVKKKEPVLEELEEENQEIIYRGDSWRLGRQRRGGGVFGALILLVVGIIFLFNNFGLLPWEIWSTLWRFWPVLLIVGAVEMILGYSWLGRTIMGLIGLTVVWLVFAFVFSWPLPARLEQTRERAVDQFLSKPETREKTVILSRGDYSEIQKREITVESGVGRLIVEADTNAELMELRSTYFDGFGRPEVGAESRNDTLKINVRTEFNARHSFFSFGKEIVQRVSFGNYDLPTDFDLDIGAGALEADFDLAKIIGIKLNVGAGSADLKFTKNSVPVEKLSIDVGAGSAKIEVPEGVGLKVNYNIGVGSFEVGSNNMRGNGVYTSEGYQQKEIKMEMVVDVGVGSAKVRFN